MKKARQTNEYTTAKCHKEAEWIGKYETKAVYTILGMGIDVDILPIAKARGF